MLGRRLLGFGPFRKQKHGKSVLLALDWAMAFDSVSPESLAVLLTRFGTPAEFVSALSTQTDGFSSLFDSIISTSCFIFMHETDNSKEQN